MCIQELKNKYGKLNNCDFDTVTVDGLDIDYLIFKKETRGTSKPKVYAQYFIFDFTGSNASEMRSKFEDDSVFKDFQSHFFRKNFLSMESDLRYNMYLVMLVDDLSSASNLMRQQADFDYCKKIVAEENDLPLFLDIGAQLIKDDENSSAIEKIIEKTITKIQEYSSKSDIMSLDYTLKSPKDPKDSFVGFFNDYPLNNLNSLYKNVGFIYKDITDDVFIKTITEKKPLAVPESLGSSCNLGLDTIKRLNVYGFRNFGKKRQLEFGRVNVFWGENGAGKTSILEAIELALTKTIKKDYTSNSYNDSIAEIVSMNQEMKISSQKEDTEFLLNTCYGLNISVENNSHLLNDVFWRCNSFDTKEALKFALDSQDHYGQKSEIRSFSSFILDENYLGLLRKAEKIREVFESVIDKMQKKIKGIEECCRRHKLNANRLEKDQLIENKSSLFGYTYFWGSEEDFIPKTKNDISSVIPDRANLGLVLWNAFGYDNLNRLYTFECVDAIMNAAIRKLNSDLSECRKYFEAIQYVNQTDELVQNILRASLSRIEKIFLSLMSRKAYKELTILDDDLCAVETFSGKSVSANQMSAAHKVCLALAIRLAMYTLNKNTPNFLILDEPITNFDEYHILNFVDVVRELALSGTQIFFTTASSNVAKLFKRKFSFLGEDFCSFMVSNAPDKTEIVLEKFSDTADNPMATSYV